MTERNDTDWRSEVGEIRQALASLVGIEGGRWDTAADAGLAANHALDRIVAVLEKRLP